VQTVLLLVTIFRLWFMSSRWLVACSRRWSGRRLCQSIICSQRKVEDRGQRRKPGSDENNAGPQFATSETVNRLEQMFTYYCMQLDITVAMSVWSLGKCWACPSHDEWCSQRSQRRGSFPPSPPQSIDKHSLFRGSLG